MSRRFRPQVTATDKFYRRRESERAARDIVNSEYFKKRQAEYEQVYLTNAFIRFCYLAMELLEYKHGYKRNGLIKAVSSFAGAINEIKAGDYSRLLDSEKYYKETYGIDLYELFGCQEIGEDFR